MTLVLPFGYAITKPYFQAFFLSQAPALVVPQSRVIPGRRSAVAPEVDGGPELMLAVPGPGARPERGAVAGDARPVGEGRFLGRVAAEGRLDGKARPGRAGGPGHRLEVGDDECPNAVAAVQARIRRRAQVAGVVAAAQSIAGVEDRPVPGRVRTLLGERVRDAARREGRGGGDGGGDPGREGDDDQQRDEAHRRGAAQTAWLEGRGKPCSGSASRPILAAACRSRPSPERTVRDWAVWFGRGITLADEWSGIMPTGSTGEWPSGKAPDSGSGDRRFESFLASQLPHGSGRAVSDHHIWWFRVGKSVARAPRRSPETRRSSPFDFRMFTDLPDRRRSPDSAYWESRPGAGTRSRMDQTSAPSRPKCAGRGPQFPFGRLGRAFRGAGCRGPQD